VLRRIIVLSVVACFVQLVGPAFAQRSEEPTAADKARLAVGRVETCPKRTTEVFLRNKTSLKGCVLDVSEDHFGLVDSKTGKVTRINYDDVVIVKTRGRAAAACP
jgi:hypothetical protein